MGEKEIVKRNISTMEIQLDLLRALKGTGRTLDELIAEGELRLAVQQRLLPIACVIDDLRKHLEKPERCPGDHDPLRRALAESMADRLLVESGGSLEPSTPEEEEELREIRARLAARRGKRAGRRC